MPSAPPAVTAAPTTLADLPVLHLDDVIVVLNKPAGLLAVPGRGEAGRDSLAARVQAVLPDARVVHRLDMATSGLMLMARGASAQAGLSLAFEMRQVRKRYEAIVEGLMAADSGEIDAPLAADWPNRPRQKVDLAVGKPSLTRWQVLARGTDPTAWTRVALHPVTGRSHQLRVHLLWAGHPIRGDALYAPEPSHAARLLLHATGLAFRHPLSGDDLQFESPAPF
ncbi:MAG: RluA family pseudouridine synthase [Rubrivivax sp.]